MNSFGSRKSIVSAHFEEFDVIHLEMSVMDSGDLHFQLICSFNSFYDFDKSLLILTHNSPLRGRKFIMDDQACLELFNFMKNRFEYISEENPLEVELDYKKSEVKKVRWKTDLYREE